jgi:hypothetical protein
MSTNSPLRHDPLDTSTSQNEQQRNALLAAQPVVAQVPVEERAVAELQTSASTVLPNRSSDGSE